jgi:Mg/Co/Ni transporter MgtE
MTWVASQARQPEAMDGLSYKFFKPVVKRSLLIALVVGCILSFANQYDAFARHEFTTRLGVKVFLNFIVPFTVATLSAIFNRRAGER